MSRPLVVHEATYRQRNVAGIIHRNRLRAIVRTFERYVDAATKSWADFGCSNGFVIEEIVKTGRFHFTRLAGFDAVPELLEGARAKQIPGAEFRLFDLNVVNETPETFELVTCMETLEHVGNRENAIANVVASTRPGGLLLLTVPNETGLAGLTKFFGRLAMRRAPYGDFFANGGRVRYVCHLLANRRIDGFRAPDRHGWGPHLGFDYRRMQDDIDTRYVQPGRLTLVAKDRSSLGMNLIYAYRRER